MIVKLLYLKHAYDKVYNENSRHTSLRHEHVKQLIHDGIVNVIYVKSSNNLADPLTERLLRKLTTSTSSEMGLKPFIKTTDGWNPTFY